MESSKRNAIMKSLLKLLDERPLGRITVKDIVEDCGVNRNTFYYHFEDMTALVEAVLMEEVDQVMAQYRDITSIEQCFEAALRLSLAHRQAVYHIYLSANRDILERSLMRICDYAATRFVEGAAAGLPVSGEDRLVIIQSYRRECFGYVIDWLNHGMSAEMEKQMLRLFELRRGSTEAMLERACGGEENT